MRLKKIISIAIICLPLLAFTVHKYYFSVTQADYDAAAHSIKIVSRVFYDDLQKVFQQRFDPDLRIDESYDQQKLDSYIQRYFDQKFIVKINGKQQTLHYLGHKDELDYVVCFIEVTDIEKPRSIEIENTLLMEVFPEQKNVVYLNMGSQKKNFMLTRESDKAMLKVSQ